MRKIRLLSFFILLVTTTTFARHKHRFAPGKTDFLPDGKPFQIISGELHPARIPKQYWRQRIQMAKAMGCNRGRVYPSQKQ